MRVLVLLTCVAALAACQSSGSSGPELGVEVAPLALPGVGNACYDIEVRNDLGELVWARGDRAKTADVDDTSALCSRRFGNGPGGDIAYVGTCDATDAEPRTTPAWR